MVAAEQVTPIGELHLDAVGETWLGGDSQQSDGLVEPEAAQRHDHAHAGEEFELTFQERTTPVAFGGKWLISGRGAPDRSSDPHAVQPHAVISRHGLRLRRETRPEQRCVQAVTGSIAGEHATGAVGAVRGRRQAHDHDASVGVAEPGHTPTPIDVVSEGGALDSCHFLAPRHEPRAGPAGRHLVGEQGELSASINHDGAPYDDGVALRLGQITVDCADPEALARFWADLLGGEMVVDDDGDVLVPFADGEFLFEKDPSTKAVKNRLHLDLVPDDQAAEVARAEALGAVRVDIGQGDVSWVVLADPEGNEFCILSGGSA